MKIVGITGGTGAGKTTALEVLEKMGAVIIDCDELYHRLLASCAPMINDIDTRFPGVVTGGVLDRKKLGKRVFSDPEELDALNGITHDYVDAAVKEELSDAEKNGAELAAIDAIALLEGGLDRLCDFTVAVTAPKEQRVMRLMAREGISREYAELRIAAQKPDEFFEENCNYVLVNEYSSRERFESECAKFFAEILRRY